MKEQRNSIWGGAMLLAMAVFLSPGANAGNNPYSTSVASLSSPVRSENVSAALQSQRLEQKHTSVRRVHVDEQLRIKEKKSKAYLALLMALKKMR